MACDVVLADGGCPKERVPRSAEQAVRYLAEQRDGQALAGGRGVEDRHVDLALCEAVRHAVVGNRYDPRAELGMG